MSVHMTPLPVYSRHARVTAAHLSECGTVWHAHAMSLRDGTEAEATAATELEARAMALDAASPE